MNNLKASEDCKRIIRAFEGLRTEAYRCPAKKLTIGYGHLVTDKAETLNLPSGTLLMKADGENAKIKRPDGSISKNLTKAECEELLDLDIEKYERHVLNCIGDSKTTQNQFDAMVSFTFNLGTSNFSNSTLKREHNNGNYSLASKNFGQWVKAKNGRGGYDTLQGLVKRRKAEESLYRG